MDSEANKIVIVEYRYSDSDRYLWNIIKYIYIYVYKTECVVSFCLS